MKKNVLSLFVAAILGHGLAARAAIVPQITFTQATNAVLTWPSAPGDSFMVLHRAAFHPSRPWKLLATNLPAGPAGQTTFTHTGAFYIPPGLVPAGGGGGGGSRPPGSPAAATLAAPLASNSATTADKVKTKDNAPPALPDEKELEKLYREWLKEWEKQQPKNGTTATVQTLAATTAYSLPVSAYTNFAGGFYVITRATDDTDGDGLPDWWEAIYGLNLLADDAQADPDGDGVPNLAEYAYGTDPRDPNSKPAISVTFTSPVNTNTYFPTVQITGSINLNVRTLRFDVTNAAGVQTGLEGFITRRTVFPGAGFTNSPARYTNSFQCFDVPLTNGANTVGLRFTDAYGLTFATTVSFTVNFAASPAAPVGTVFWPANGARLGTDTFTLRGRLDNPTASVVARMTIDGEELEIGGLVERDGTFWIEDLPTPVNGPVTLVFTDAGGKATTNALNMSRSPVSLTLYDPSGPTLWDATMNLNGSVNNASARVFVNGQQATVDPSGNWSATNVPVNAGGVASFFVRAVPGNATTYPASPMIGSGGLGGLYSFPTGNPAVGGNPLFTYPTDAAFDFDKPPRIVVASYTKRSQDDNPIFETGFTNRQTVDWTYDGTGGSGGEYRYFEFKYAPGNYYGLAVTQQTDYVTYPYPGTNGTGTATGALNTGERFTNTYAAYPSFPWETTDARERTESRNYNEHAQTTLQLMTGGLAVPGAGGVSVFDVPVSGTDVHGAPAVIPPEKVQAFGQTLVDDYSVGRLNIPANATLDATPVVLLAQSLPAGGGRGSFSVFDSTSVVRPTTTIYYVTNNRTNREILYLGYSQAVVPYMLTDYGGRSSIHWEQVLGTGKYIVTATNYYSSSLRKYKFVWSGAVPDLPGGPQVRNTRRYVDPNTRELAAAVTTSKDYGRNNIQLIGTNKMGIIKVTAKALVARQGAGDPLTWLRLPAASARPATP